MARDLGVQVGRDLGIALDGPAAPSDAADDFNRKLRERAAADAAKPGRSEGPRQHTYVNASGEERKSDVNQGEGWFIKTMTGSKSPGPGFERKYPPTTAKLMAAGQGATLGFADDAVAGLVGPIAYLTRDNPNETYAGAQNRATRFVEDQFRGAAQENPEAAPYQFAGSLVAPNPLGVARGAVRAARPAIPLTASGDKVLGYMDALTGNGLSNVASRRGAMSVQAAKAGAYSATERLGSQPIGQKDVGDAVTAGGEGSAFSLPLQVLPLPGTTGFGRLTQTPRAQRITPDPRNPFAASEPLHGPQGVAQYANPARHADLAGTLLNEESLREAGGAARVASLGGSLGNLQNALDARPQFGVDAPALGNSLNSYKIPQSFLPPNQVKWSSPSSWAQWLREHVPASKAVLGTGEVPLLPPQTGNARAGKVFDAAIEEANQRIGVADAATPPVDVNAAFRAAREGVNQAASLHGVPAEDLGRVGRILEDSRSKFPTSVEVRPVSQPGIPGMTVYPPIPGVATMEQLVAAGYPPAVARQMLDEAGAKVIEPTRTRVVTPQQPLPIAGTPGGFIGPGEVVQVPVPEAAKWTVGKPVNVGPGAGAKPGSSPGTSTQVSHRNSVPDTIPQELPPTYVAPGPSPGVLARPPEVSYVPSVSAPTGRTVLAPFNAPAPVPAGDVRQKLGGTLRREADYRGLEKAGSNSALGAASGQTALGRFLDEHWQANLNPEELAAAREAKDLAATAHAGMDINNPNRGATNAPRALGGEMTAAGMGMAASSMGPAAAILARNASRALEKQSPIFPKRAGFNTRLAEGLEGQGIDFGWQTAGTVGRGIRLLPGRANSALVSDAESEGPIMSIDPNAGPWNTALQRFLGVANPVNLYENLSEVERRAFRKNNPSK